jgi:DNA primase
MTDAKEIKARINILTLVEEIVELHQHGQEWQGLCPFHQEKTPSFRVNPDKGKYHCFGCGAGGDVFTFIEKTKNLSFAEALQLLADRLHLQPGASYHPPVMTAPKPTAKQNTEWRQYLDGLLPIDDTPGELYLTRRGIPAWLARMARVKYHPRWYENQEEGWTGSPAVFFPIRDQAGELVAGEGRYLDCNRKPKVQSAGPKKRGAFYFSGLFEAKIELVFIVESPINALSLLACGYYAVATCGCENHAAWLPKSLSGKRVIIAFDNDDAGMKGTQRLAAALNKEGMRAQRLAPLIPGTDLNDYLLSHGQESMREELDEIFSSKTW